MPLDDNNEHKLVCETYKPEELAEMLGIGRTAVYKGLRDGTIPSIRFGNRYVIPKVAIVEWLKKAGT